MKKETKKRIKQTSLIVLSIILIVISVKLILIYSQQPSNDRNWIPDFAVLSYTQQDGNLITIYNIRNNTYHPNNTYEIKYYNRTFNTEEMKQAYFLYEPFSKLRAMAHTFLSFEFENGTTISFSVEARREIGENYSAVKGLFNNYELIYVWGDEQDNIIRRTSDGYSIQMIPLNISKEKAIILFEELSKGTNDLKENPRFYNSITTTCTTVLADFANRVTPGKIKWTLAKYMPGYSVDFLYKKGLLNTTIPLEEVYIYYNITAKSNKYANTPEYYKKIREFNITI